MQKKDEEKQEKNIETEWRQTTSTGIVEIEWFAERKMHVNETRRPNVDSPVRPIKCTWANIRWDRQNANEWKRKIHSDCLMEPSVGQKSSTATVATAALTTPTTVKAMMTTTAPATTVTTGSAEIFSKWLEKNSERYAWHIQFVVWHSTVEKRCNEHFQAVEWVAKTRSKRAVMLKCFHIQRSLQLLLPSLTLCRRRHRCRRRLAVNCAVLHWHTLHITVQPQPNELGKIEKSSNNFRLDFSIIFGKNRCSKKFQLRNSNALDCWALNVWWKLKIRPKLMEECSFFEKRIFFVFDTSSECGLAVRSDEVWARCSCHERLPSPESSLSLSSSPLLPFSITFNSMAQKRERQNAIKTEKSESETEKNVDIEWLVCARLAFWVHGRAHSKNASHSCVFPIPSSESFCVLAPHPKFIALQQNRATKRTIRNEPETRRRTAKRKKIRRRAVLIFFAHDIRVILLCNQQSVMRDSKFECHTTKRTKKKPTERPKTTTSTASTSRKNHWLKCGVRRKLKWSEWRKPTRKPSTQLVLSAATGVATAVDVVVVVTVFGRSFQWTFGSLVVQLLVAFVRLGRESMTKAMKMPTTASTNGNNNNECVHNFILAIDVETAIAIVHTHSLIFQVPTANRPRERTRERELFTAMSRHTIPIKITDRTVQGSKVWNIFSKNDSSNGHSSRKQKRLQSTTDDTFVCIPHNHRPKSHTTTVFAFRFLCAAHTFDFNDSTFGKRATTRLYNHI